MKKQQKTIKELELMIKSKNETIEERDIRIRDLESLIDNIKGILNIKSRGWLDSQVDILSEINMLKARLRINEGSESERNNTINILHRIIRVALKDQTLTMEEKAKLDPIEMMNGSMQERRY